MTISKELLDELLGGVERPEDLLGDKGLMKELMVLLMERMLGNRTLDPWGLFLCTARSVRLARGSCEAS